MWRRIPVQQCCQAANWLQSSTASLLSTQQPIRGSLASSHAAAQYQHISTGSTQSSDRSSSGSNNSSRSSSGSSSSTPWHLQDQIILRGLMFHGYHGALPEENVLGQKFVVDATLWADLAAAGRSDQLQDTIDYSKAYSVIQDIVQGPARVLQEAVAEDCCQQLLQLNARVSAVQVYIRKPHVALTGTLDSVGVQIFRTRE